MSTDNTPGDNPANAAVQKDGARYRPKKMAILARGLVLFLCVGVVAWALCTFRVRYETQAIKNQQREVQQAWLDKSLDAIRVWRGELVEQARFISSSEMFRLFVIDTQNLSQYEFGVLAHPDALHSHDETIRTMAEQYTYIQDLLADFTKRRAWNDARILLPDGSTMVAPPFSTPLAQIQIDLAKKAADEGHATFGPIRQTEKGLVMDMADPLFEVLGAATPKIVAVLLCSVPMDRPLATFLARNGEQTETLLPRIVNQEVGHLFMALFHAGKIMLEPARKEPVEIEPMPFALRPGLDGKEEVYSMGGVPTGLDWLFVLETPASEVNALIAAQTLQIYGLGILGTLGVTLLGLWYWASQTSKHNEEEARRLEGLYNKINNQKMMLDSVNDALQAGLLLVDQYGRVQMSNPTFNKISNKTEIKQDTPLQDCLPDNVALALLGDMNRVRNMDKSASVEFLIPTRMAPRTPSENRLYRIDLFPCTSLRDAKTNPDRCVAVFKDITEFRRKAEMERVKQENERKRQAALIAAFVRAVESVDPHLVGHSDKMAGISELLAKKLELDEQQEETLKLAAKLSQVGKMFVPRALLTKSGKLTDEEMQEMRKIPEYADSILHDMHFDLPVRETVREIGERVDGSGKPKGLTGEQISLSGRALAVVNAFIAMTSKRAWRKDGAGMSIDEAKNALFANRGFDQNVVNALAQLTNEEITAVLDKNR